MVVSPTRNPRYVAVLAIAAALILIVGWMIRPRAIPERPPPVPSESELQQLARRAERRTLEDMTSFFAGTTRDLERSLAWMDGATGIAWDQTRIITAPVRGGTPHDIVLNSAYGAVAAAPTIAGPNLPLAVLMASASMPLPPVTRAATLPQVGDWIVVVWRNDKTAAFAPASFAGTTPASCGTSARAIVPSLALTRAMAGGGVFNIDGELLGVVLPCGDGVAAVDAASVDAIVAQADTLEQRLLARTGIVLAPLADEDRKYFKNVAGLIVREVWVGSMADTLGIWPGDIVTTVNGQAVAALSDAQPLAAPAADPIALRVRRGTRELTFTLVEEAARAPAAGDSPEVGLQIESAPRLFRIDGVTPGSRAAQAGVRAGDRLVRINRTSPASVAQIERTLSGSARLPVLLEVLRDSRRLAIVLP